VEIMRGVPLGIESGTILSRLDEALRMRRAKPHPACRYSTYRKTLFARSHGIPSTTATQEQLYATGELFQMEWIAACCIHDDRLRRAVEEAFFHDPAVPASASIHSPGRDLQFELYVATRLQMAGLSPTLAEPDIQASLSGWHFGVAVKRVKSSNAFLKEIQSACDQIKRTGKDGIIALDYSYVAAGQNAPYLKGDLNAGHAWAHGFSTREFHARWRSVVGKVSRTPEVFGVFIVARLFQLHPDMRTHVISELLVSRPLCDNGDPRMERFAAIEDRLRTSVLPNQGR
jgi:hypothetical protein